MKSLFVELSCPPDEIQIQHIAIDADKLSSNPKSMVPGRPVRLLFSGGVVVKKGGKSDRWASMGTAGREFVTNHNDVKVLVPQLEKKYDSFLRLI